MFGHGLMVTCRVRDSGLWASVPNSALINQWLTKKKRSEGHQVCQGQETLNTYSGQGEEWGIVQIQTEWEQHGRDVALAVVYVEKDGAVAFTITTHVCIALVRHVRDLFTP